MNLSFQPDSLSPGAFRRSLSEPCHPSRGHQAGPGQLKLSRRSPCLATKPTQQVLRQSRLLQAGLVCTGLALGTARRPRGGTRSRKYNNLGFIAPSPQPSVALPLFLEATDPEPQRLLSPGLAHATALPGWALPPAPCPSSLSFSSWSQANGCPGHSPPDILDPGSPEKEQGPPEPALQTRSRQAP